MALAIQLVFIDRNVAIFANVNESSEIFFWQILICPSRQNQQQPNPEF